MTWTARSLIAFAAGLFAATLFATGLYNLIGTPGCESTVTTPIRCSEESGWWALVAGGGLAVTFACVRAARQGAVRRLLFGGLLLGGGAAPLVAAIDGHTDSGGWIAGGVVALLLGTAVVAGLAVAALRAVREPDMLARPPEPLGQNEPATPPAPAADAPAVRLPGGEDPFGREPGESTDPFGGQG